MAVAFLFVFTIGFNRNAVKATDFVQQVSPVLTDTGAPVAMVVFKAMAKGYYLRK